MIKTEFYMERKDGIKLYRTYSDRNMMIQKTEQRNFTAKQLTLRTADLPTLRPIFRLREK